MNAEERRREEEDALLMEYETGREDTFDTTPRDILEKRRAGEESVLGQYQTGDNMDHGTVAERKHR